MPSYKKLAVFALAASTVSPALAAPTRESQNQARADLEARVSGELLKHIATQFGLAAIPTALFSMVSGSKRTTETSEGQSIAEMEGRALGDYKLDRRELSMLSKLFYGTLAALGGTAAGSVLRKDVSPEEKMLNILSNRDVGPVDVLAALRHISRTFDELD